MTDPTDKETLDLWSIDDPYELSQQDKDTLSVYVWLRSFDMPISADSLKYIYLVERKKYHDMTPEKHYWLTEKFEQAERES